MADLGTCMCNGMYLETLTANAANCYILLLHPAPIASASDGPVNLQAFQL